tara:strand:+ start:159 stop:515 length:357 start_codon:yes stop_codon:yes gene_type:complete
MTDPEAKMEEGLNSSNEVRSHGFLNIVFSTFISVFLAELGDKTQIATLLLSAESGKPFQVFIGAALALVCSSLFVVALGRWFSTNISQIRIKFFSGILLVLLGIWFGIQSAQYFISPT